MSEATPRAQFDHLVVAIRRLPEGIAEFESLTGIKPGVGGKHPDRGTENALVSLGHGGYFEIIAPQAGAKLSPVDERMRQVDHLRIIDWALAVSGIEEAIETLRGAGFAVEPPQAGSRVTPSGERLAWTVFRLADRSLSTAPFFIHWSPDTTHPSTTAPGGCTLAGLTVRHPDADRLSKALAALGVGGVTYVEGAPGIEARLACGDKTATLTTSS